MNVAKSEVEKYGVIKGNFLKSKISKVTALVEKPKSQDAPSNLAVVGRYVLKNSIFRYLAKITKGTGNEIQLTDAISLLAKNEDVFSYRFSGKRYDCGSKLGYLKAQIAASLTDPTLKRVVKKEIENILKKDKQ